MTKILMSVNGFIWGVPVLGLILGVGVYLSVRTGCAQITLFPEALRTFARRFRKRDSSGVSPYRALCTALAATVGTGNIAGVAGAIALGGPGAVFWMWISAGLGMIIKFAEAVLAVRFRQRCGNEYAAGPMHIIKNGLPRRFSWLAGVYCFFGIVASFGVGNMTQINAVVMGVDEMVSFFGGSVSGSLHFFLGMILAVVIGIMLLGGAGRIGAIAEALVPFASVAYLIMGTVVLALRLEAIPQALCAIVQGAFSPRAVTGGLVGSGFQALRIGVSRGVFTNEAGIGTAAIAHGSAQVDHPVQQGLMGIMEVFLDTVVICTMTALVILCTGVGIPYGCDEGVALTTRAFSSVYGEWIAVPIALALCCFAFATVLGWGLYGARCAQYLFGNKSWKTFALLQALAVIPGAVLNTAAVWLMAETINALMAIPNLVAITFLTKEVVGLTEEYRQGISANGNRSADLLNKL